MVFQHSIKSRTLCVIAVIFMLQAFFSGRSIITTYEEYRRLRLKEINQGFSLHCRILNTRVVLLQKSIQAFAMQAETYLALPSPWRPNREDLAKRVIEETPEAVGGGLWLEPYVDDESRLRSCVYYGRDNRGVHIVPDYESSAYNYHQQMWYTFIKEYRNQWSGVIWTPPYEDHNDSVKLQMVTLGHPLYRKGQFMGMVTLDWKLADISQRISSLMPTQNSFALFADLYHDVVLADTTQEGGGFGDSVKRIPWLAQVGEGQTRFDHNGVPHIAFMQTLDNGMALILAIPEDELYAPVRRELYGMLVSLSVFSLILLAVTWYLLQRFISKPVLTITSQAQRIGNGDLGTRIPVTDQGELGSLAQVLNNMTEKLQKHITDMHRLTQEKERIATELDIATRIQTAMLPCIFPPFPDRTEFDLYATMRPAREVGGDFYDFFLVDEKHLALVIADVSGKGVPAALFMVIAKTLLKNHMQQGLLPGAALEATNRQLCDNNSMDMFVTLWAGLLTLESGHLRYSNAGHNPPLWRHEDAAFAPIENRRSFVLGGMENTRYTEMHCTLTRGDRLLLYTDGITEAESPQEMQFGLQRLYDCANASTGLSLEHAASSIMQAVDDFAGPAPQADDITLLLLEYTGLPVQDETSPGGSCTVPTPPEPQHLPPVATWTCHVPANVAHFPELHDRLETTLGQHDCPARASHHLAVALEEVFVNIVSYAYPAGQGEVDVTCRLQTLPLQSADGALVHDDIMEVTLVFQDEGVPFNPLDQAPPDLTLSGEERNVGGLGIHMLNTMMDSLHYARINGVNTLTLTKQWRVPRAPGAAHTGV